MKIANGSENTLSTPILTALFSVYFFWGTTYLAIKVAVETLPPFLMLAFRYGLTGGLMFFFLLLRGEPAPSFRQWRGAFIVGILMLFLCTGAVTMAEFSVPSNITATLIASVPLWIAFFQWAIFREGRPGFWTLTGLIVGFVGVVLLVAASGAKDGGGTWGGYLLLIFASSMWALGSLISRIVDVPKSAFMSVSIQMICGALCCLAAAIFAGELGSFDVSKFSLRSIIALCYLTVFGSFVGFGSYVWLLRNSTPALASTYAYVNPVVAILVGWIFLGEALTVGEIAAALVILAAVVAIIKGNAKKR